MIMTYIKILDLGIKKMNKKHMSRGIKDVTMMVNFMGHEICRFPWCPH